MIVQFDQRGCGKFTPFVVAEENTTQDLIKDIETIRDLLKVEVWHTVFGGSWDQHLLFTMLKDIHKKFSTQFQEVFLQVVKKKWNFFIKMEQIGYSHIIMQTSLTHFQKLKGIIFFIITTIFLILISMKKPKNNLLLNGLNMKGLFPISKYQMIIGKKLRKINQSLVLQNLNRIILQMVAFLKNQSRCSFNFSHSNDYNQQQIRYSRPSKGYLGFSQENQKLLISYCSRRCSRSIRTWNLRIDDNSNSKV
ncbi:hypothetical protein ABPG72_012614 [Tetrahymena utriculariae]